MKTKNSCTICGEQGIPGLIAGQGKCQYHYNVGQFGKEWADKCRAKEDLPTQDVWLAGYNMPGYMPENEPTECESFDDTKRHIIFMMKQFEDDCGDYTANKEVGGEDIAEEQEALATEYCHGAEEVNLQSGEFSTQYGNYVFWVTKGTK